MTSKDRTRQKLVGSMRKTKSAAGIGSGGIDAETGVSGSEESGTMKPAKPVAPRTAGASGNQNASMNGYQSGRRVWPD